MANESTSIEMLNDFHEDAMRWKSMLAYKENEIVFLKRLLGSNAFTKSAQHLFEKLETLKKELEEVTLKTKALKTELADYSTQLKGILECEDVSCDTYYTDEHKHVKKQFTKFYTDFNEFKTKVFNVTGGIL